MTATTDLTAKITALNHVLANATVECPCRQGASEGCETCQNIEDCLTCQGTGRIARFPGFRQECDLRIQHWDGSQIHPPSNCWACNGLGWQVRAGGLEYGFTGLAPGEFSKILEELDSWRLYRSPRPTVNEILAEGLRLVIKVAGLEVPDA